MTTLAQGEAILDVIDYCSQVSAAYAEFQMAQGKDMAKDARQQYREALDHLTYLFREAVALGAKRDIVTQQILERLPTSALRDIMEASDTS